MLVISASSCHEKALFIGKDYGTNRSLDNIIPYVIFRFHKHPDGSEKPQQKSGAKTEKEANKAREKTIAELYNGTFVVQVKINVADFMIFWLETDFKKRTDSHETYYNYCEIVKNHIIPILGKKKMMAVIRGDIQKLFNTKPDYSRSIAELVKTIMNVSFRYVVTNKVIRASPVDGIGLPKAEKRQQKSGFRIRNIDTQQGTHNN